MNDIRHAGNPVTGEYTLCGIARDCNHLDACSDEPDVDFAVDGHAVTCLDCRKVIAYCKTFKHWKEPTND